MTPQDRVVSAVVKILVLYMIFALFMDNGIAFIVALVITSLGD